MNAADDPAIDRRTLLAALGVGAFCLPIDFRAQVPGKVRQLGFLVPSQASVFAHLIGAFNRGLRDHGLIEGENLHIEVRSSDGHDDEFPRLAAELIASKPDVIVAVTVPAIRAVQQATKTIPIVMLLSSDPVQLGLVASLGRPGGNTTGLASVIQDLAPKRLELLKEAIPTLSSATVLWNPSNPAMVAEWHLAQAAAGTLRVKLHSVEVRSPLDLEAAFAAVLRDRSEALMVVADPLTFRLRAQIVDFAAQHRLPAVYGAREMVEAGGLMSCGTNVADLFRRAGGYVEKILKGANPADLPVEQPLKVEVIVNLKSARAIGLTLPQTLLIRADETIQ
jgi:putative ABC transport system substrate-binding protein